MKYIFSIILFSFSLLGISQEKFNKIDSELEGANMRNVFQMADTGYVMVGGSYHDALIDIDVNYYNSLGDFVWNKHYGDDVYNIFHGHENACIKTEGGYILAGSSSGSLDTHMVYLVKFDEAFDTLWTKHFFKDTNWVVGRNICNTNDGGYLIVGETELNSDSVWTSNNTKGLMLKVDADGNYQWFKSFGTDDNNDYLYKVVQTHDGGYLVGGGTNSWQDDLDAIDRGDWYVVKTDVNGNEQWHRRYGNPILAEGRVTQILKATDTTYYITGGWAYDRNNTGSYIYKESYIVKLDKNFDEVYQLKYENQAYYKSYIMAAIETADSNILLAGSRTHYFEEYSYGFNPRTTLTKMTPDGEILWERYYVAGHDTVAGDHKGYSVKQTTDGGYVIGGWVNNENLTPTQQLWLVKTDSVGCDDTGDFWVCATNAMVNEFVDNPNFEMYPNPANDFIVIASEASQSQVSTVEIYNMQGQLIRVIPSGVERVMSSGVERVMSSGVETSLTIDISDLEKGVYIVRIGEQTRKLIIE